MFAGLQADEEYYGPPRPGQSFAQYESYMSMKNIAIGGGVVALAVINPVIGVAVGIGWLLSGPEKTKSKPTTQGG
jgi:hypothetical protein